MPAALPVDRDQVKIVALAVGVREAARQFQLPEATVQAWSARNGWFSEQEAVVAVQEAAMERKRESFGLHPSATKSAADILKAYDGETRLSLAKGIARGAKTVEQMPGEEVLMASQNIASLTKSAAVVHGWASGDNNVNLRLDIIAAQSGDCPVIDV